MAKVEVLQGGGRLDLVETPTQEVVKASNETATCKDSRGRTIKFRRLKPSIKQRLFKIAGPENSKNEAWMAGASTAVVIVDIDGEPQTVNNEREIEVLLDVLDDEGFVAVNLAYVKAFGATSLEKIIADAKN